MLDVARHGREYLTDTLGLSRRLAARVGALMRRRIACTEALLEEARENRDLQDLLLAPELRDAGDEVGAVLERLLDTERYAQLARSAPIAVASEDDWSIIALAEEIEAEEGFRLSEEREESKGPPPSRPQPPATRPAHARSQPEQEEAEPDESFTEQRLSELRVAVFASASSAERVGALRRLAFAPVDEAERARVFVQALGEEDAALRAAAAGALQALGLSGDVAQAIRLLAEGTEEERDFAARRLAGIEAAADSLERRAAVMSLLGTLRMDESSKVRASAVRSLSRVAPELKGFRDILGDVVRLLVEQLVAGLADMGDPVRRAFLDFQEFHAAAVTPLLIEEARKTDSLEIRALLLGAAARGKAPDDLRAHLRALVADCLMALPAESPEAHTLGTFLVDQGDAGVAEILARLDGVDIAHQRFLVRLLDNTARFRTLSDALRIRLAEQGLDLLRSGPRHLQADLFESQLLYPDALEPEARARVAQAVVASARHLAVPQILENAEGVLVHLGPAVIPVLLDAALQHLEGIEGPLACRALGRIAADADTQAADQVAALREALRRLQAASFTPAGNRRELYVAMGRICATGAFEEEVTRVIRRNLFNRLEGSAADAGLIEALGWMAASPTERPEVLREIADQAFGHLEAETPETTVSTKIQRGEEVFVLEGQLEIYAELLPACIDALEHIVLSPSAPADMVSAFTRRLLGCWRESVSFRVQWSPANVTRLTTMLGETGASDRLSQPLKAEIVHTLAGRMSEVPVLEALSRVLEAAGASPEMDRLAAAVAMRILRMMEEEKDLTMEDREVYLRVLGRVVSRGALEVRGGGGERLMQRAVEEIALGMSDGVPNAMGIMLALRESPRLPDALRATVAKELERFTTLMQH